ncbi:MAG: hypothetical protein MJ238_07040 [Bacilli bacterium]|nr:hypothetical protein [Bacilli bacterium]
MTIRIELGNNNYIETEAGVDGITVCFAGYTFMLNSQNFSQIMVYAPGLFHEGQIALLNSKGGIIEPIYEGHKFFGGYTIPKKEKKNYNEFVRALRITGYKIVNG